jgi:hypothetical protein
MGMPKREIHSRIFVSIGMDTLSDAPSGGIDETADRWGNEAGPRRKAGAGYGGVVVDTDLDRNLHPVCFRAVRMKLARRAKESGINSEARRWPGFEGLVTS